MFRGHFVFAVLKTHWWLGFFLFFGRVAVTLMTFDTFPVSEYFNFPLIIIMCYSTRFYKVVGTTKYHKLAGQTNRHTDDVFVPITSLRQGTIRKQTSIDMLNVNYFVDNWVFVFEHKLPRMQSIRSETCNLVKYTSSIDYPPTLYWCSHTEFGVSYLMFIWRKNMSSMYVSHDAMFTEIFKL